jgi:hypothetical protein
MQPLCAPRALRRPARAAWQLAAAIRPPGNTTRRNVTVHARPELRRATKMRLGVQLVALTLLLLSLADGVEGRARKKNRSGSASSRGGGGGGGDDADTSSAFDRDMQASVEVTLTFDGTGKLGLAFRKNVMPLTIRHITPDTWASNQTDLVQGMELATVGATVLMGRTYDDAVDLLRAAAGASSEQALLSLTFVQTRAPPDPADNAARQGSSWAKQLITLDEYRWLSVPKRLVAACKAIRERDLKAAHRLLLAFMKTRGWVTIDVEKVRKRIFLRRFILKMII